MNEEKDLSVDTESTDTTSTNEETTKTYTQKEVDDMQAKWEGNFQKKLDKAISRKMRDTDGENFKKDQLIDILKKQTKAETIDDLLDISEKQYGITVQRTKANNQNDEKVLGKNDAKEILDFQDDEYTEKEINRLANLKRTGREEEAYTELKTAFEGKRALAERNKEIKEKGLNEEVVESSEFKEFEKKFAKDTSLSDIYELYSKVNIPKEEKPFSVGSLKDTRASQTDAFFTVDEFNALTEKDLKNPKVYEKAMKTIQHFYNNQ